MIEAIGAFLLYFVIGTALTAVYLVTYNFATTHDELALIRKNEPAAAVALGGSLVGFALPLSKSIAQAHSLADFVVWGLVALIVQVLVYWLIRLVVPDLSRRIEAGEMAAAVFLGASSLAVGMINAASMTV